MKIATLFLVLFNSVNLYGQLSLSMDENNKIIFTEVVKADSVKQEQLYTNAKNWLQKNKFVITENANDSLAGRIVATNHFFVYAKGYISKKIHGKITFQAVIEIKKGRYRYTFSNFVFAYYKESRTYKMVPSGKTKALEDEKAQGWQDTWDSHRKVTQNKMVEYSNNLNSSLIISLITKNEAKEQRKPVDKDNW